MISVKKHDLDYFWYFDAILDICRSSDRFLNCSMFSSLAFNVSYKGSLTRIYYSKQYSLAHLHSYEYFFLLLKDLNFFILI